MLPLEYHLGLVADGRRTLAYADAIRRTVRPGDVVVDLGCGTGILAIVAAKAGARRVYAVEEGPIAVLADALVRENGLEEIVRVVRGRSTEIDLPERANVLVTETLGSFGPEERIRTWIADARARWLVDGARIVPSALGLWIAPALAPALEGALGSVGSRLGIRLGPFDDALACTPRGATRAALVASGGRIGPRVVGTTIDLAAPPTPSVRVEATWPDAGPGMEEANAIVAGFRAHLAEETILDRDPGEDSHWPLPVFPLARRHPTRGMRAWVEYGEVAGHAWGVESAAGKESHAEALASERALRAQER